MRSERADKKSDVDNSNHCGIGSWAGGSYAFTSYVDNKGTGIQSASEDNSNLTEVENAYQLIKENALAKPDAQQLQDGAIKGMLETLDDPYSSFWMKNPLRS